MKTATIPSLRVDPELRSAAESVLLQGESLSGFIEASLRAEIASRQMQQEFIARGLASAEESRFSGEYFSVDSVLGDMDALLANAAR